jgi:F-type H+-transporting ATPase subunit b
MFTNPTFWFLVSFILFFILFGRAIWTMVSGGLDDRSRRIETDIQEAIQMREEAQALLNDIKARQMEAGKHAEAILEHARLEAERLRSEAAKELDEYLKHRELLVEQRIEFAEREALKDIRDTAVRMAIEASEKILANVVSHDTDSQIADQAIQELSAVGQK